MKFEIGQQLVVLGDWEHMNHRFPIGAVVEVMAYNPMSHIVTCKGCIQSSINWIHEKDLEPYNKKQETMKAMKDAVLTVAKQLAKANNTVTTLEIKLELRRDYPYYYWTQQVVSNYMDQLAGDGIFTYTDNGTYRTYSLASPTFQSATAGPVSKSLGSTSASQTATGALGGVTGSSPMSGGTVGYSRNRKGVANTVDRTALYGLVKDTGFERAKLKDGITVDRNQIKWQKKSPTGYFTQSKLNKVTEITVSGKTYFVK